MSPPNICKDLAMCSHQRRNLQCFIWQIIQADFVDTISCGCWYAMFDHSSEFLNDKSICSNMFWWFHGPLLTHKATRQEQEVGQPTAHFCGLQDSNMPQEFVVSYCFLHTPGNSVLWQFLWSSTPKCTVYSVRSLHFGITRGSLSGKKQLQTHENMGLVSPWVVRIIWCAEPLQCLRHGERLRVLSTSFHFHQSCLLLCHQFH